MLRIEDHVKVRSHHDYVFFYGRKVTKESLYSNLVFMARVVAFCAALVLLPARPYCGQVLIAFVATSLVFFGASKYLHSLLANKWVQFQLMVNESTILLCCIC